MNPVILIPARMASTRLPGKPLADIDGKPMIVQVWQRAMDAGLGPVCVAAAEPGIKAAVSNAGGNAVLTDPDLPSGSDRIYQALQQIDGQEKFDCVVNLQGDLPTLDPGLIKAVLEPLENSAVDMATLVVEINDDAEKHNPNVVKAVCAFGPRENIARTLYFTRATAPWGEGPLYHHIGIYAYRRAALKRFVGLKPGLLERRERLEQLRALESGMRIDARRVDTGPLGVDTPDDLEKARHFFQTKRV